MKKYILMFGLTLVMGLFIANNVTAQGNWENNPANPATWTTGNVGIGISTPIAPLHVHRTAQGLSQLQRMVHNAGGGAGIVFDKARGGESIAGNNDFMGAFLGRLYDGAEYQPAAGIRFQAAGGPHSLGSVNGQLIFQTRALGGPLTTHMTLTDKGGLALGTNYVPDGYRLAVEGKVIAEELMIQLRGDWPDFVFQSDYNLMPLNELESFVTTNKHLPGIPSEAAINSQGGFNVGETSTLLLQKIEELTLYIFELNKRIEELEK